MVLTFWAWLGRGPAMCQAVWVGVRGGEQFARAAIRGRGGGGPGFSGVCAGGVCGPKGGSGVPWGVGRPSVGVCELPSFGGGEGCPAGWTMAGVCCCLGGWGRPVSRSPGARVLVGSGWAARGGGHGRGFRGWACSVGLCVGS